MPIKSQTKNEEFDRFKTLAKKLISVPKKDIQKHEEKEKKKAKKS